MKNLEPLDVDFFVGPHGMTDEEYRQSILETTEWIKNHKLRPEYRAELLEAKTILERLGWSFPDFDLQSVPPTMGPGIPPS